MQCSRGTPHSTFRLDDIVYLNLLIRSLNLLPPDRLLCSPEREFSQAFLGFANQSKRSRILDCVSVATRAGDMDDLIHRPSISSPVGLAFLLVPSDLFSL